MFFKVSAINIDKVNNRLIAKNAIILYFRMFFLMLVSLYTSRVVLQSLGVVDYGIYHVVGGLVALLAIFRDSFNTSVTRYVAYEIGNPKGILNSIFATSLVIQIFIGIVAVCVAETIGLYFFNYVLEIPENRREVAFWCYQLALIDFTIRLLSIPYNSVIVAHERMSVFAYISIIDGLGQLLIAWIIAYSSTDRLLFYSILICTLSIIIRFGNVLYCKSHFEECKGRLIFDKKIFYKMSLFAGWNMIGSTSYQLMTQGVVILLNIYYGIAVNAASAIASKISNVTSLLVNNFTRALNPQIIKTYARGQKNELYSLMFRGSKFSFFLMLYAAIPLLCETKGILDIWLVNVPEHTVTFAKLTIMISMVEVLSNSMETTIIATGDVRKYQIYVRGFGFVVLPMALFFIWLGFMPEMVLVASLLTTIILLIIKVKVLEDQVGMPIVRFIDEVIKKVLLTTLMSLIIPLLLCIIIEESQLRIVIIILFSILNTSFAIYFFGASQSEKTFIFNTASIILRKLR